MVKNRPTYSDDFKLKIVEEYQNGMKAPDISNKYSIGESTVYKWLSEFKKSKSFKAADNRSAKENEILNLRKKVKKLQMENDILKQLALLLKKK